MIHENELEALKDSGEFTTEQRLTIVEGWLAQLLPVVIGYVTKEGEAVPGVVRRVASVEMWVKIGVVGGGVFSIVNTFGLADPIKHALRVLLGGP